MLAGLLHLKYDLMLPIFLLKFFITRKSCRHLEIAVAWMIV